MRKHVYLKHVKCELSHCQFCDGGLLYCTVCHQGEGDLTVECLGDSVAQPQSDWPLSGPVTAKDIRSWK